MRIGVNARLLIEGKLEGLGLYSHEIVKRMIAHHPEDEFVLFFDRPFAPQFTYGQRAKGVVLPVPARHPLLWWIWFEWLLPRALKQYDIDVLFTPDGYTSLRSKVPEVMIVHDLSYLRHNRHTPRLVQRYYEYFVPRYLRKAKTMGCVSQATKEDILNHYDVDPDRMFIAYNGCRPVFRPLSREEVQATRDGLSSGHPYFLFVGALHPRKNVETMLLAYDRYRQEGGSIPGFVVVGRKAWMTKSIERVYQEMEYKEEVVFTDYLDLEALARVVGSAFALLYMSLFEGFGVPLLEAMHCDIPIITSDVSSMPEVTGDAALKVPPTDIQAIVKAMLTLSSDAVLCEQLIKHGRRQRVQFDWDRSAALIYEKLKALGAPGERNRTGGQKNA